MRNQVGIAEIQAIDTELQSMDKDAIRTQNISYLMELGLRIGGWISFVGQEKAKAKMNLNDAFIKNMMDVTASMKANGVKLGDMLIKRFVEAKCAEQEFVYDMVEQTHKSCEKNLDFLRTCISGLKAEINADLFQSNQRA